MTDEMKKEQSNGTEQTNAKSSEGPIDAALIQPKKSRIKIYLSLAMIAVIVVFFSYQSYRAYFWGGPKEIIIPDAIQDLAVSVTPPPTTNPDTKTSTPIPTKKPTMSPAATPTQTTPGQSQTSSVPSLDPLEFFVEVATGYQTKSGTSKRWTKNPVYIGGKDSEFSPPYSDCLNQIISGFNSESSDIKLVRNGELADIKIYWVTQQELEEKYNTDTGRPYATWSVDSGRIYGATIVMPTDANFVEDLKCYTMKHEVMHAIGFAHSDQTSYSLMGMPTVGKNLINGLTDVDKRIIRMLYSNGLPMKQNAGEIREYFKTHQF